MAEVLLDKRLLIFDFDGTLADTTPLHAAAFAEVLAPLGISIDYSRIAGLKTLDAMRQCLAQAGRTLTDTEVTMLATAKQQCARRTIAQSLQPLRGVDEFLRWARPRYRLALYSSGSRGTVTIAMRKLGYTGWFDPILCAEDVIHAKPDPEGFLKVLSLTGVEAQWALVFEDSDAGVEAANRAGLATLDVRVTPIKVISINND